MTGNGVAKRRNRRRPFVDAQRYGLHYLLIAKALKDCGDLTYDELWIELFDRGCGEWRKLLLYPAISAMKRKDWVHLYREAASEADRLEYFIGLTPDGETWVDTMLLNLAVT